MTRHAALAATLFLVGCACWAPGNENHKKSCYDDGDSTSDPATTPPPVPDDPGLSVLTCPQATVESSQVELDVFYVQNCFVQTDGGGVHWVAGVPAEIATWCSTTQTSGICTIFLDDPCTPARADASWCVDDATCAAAGGPPSNTVGETWVTPDGMCTYDTAACTAQRQAALADLESRMNTGDVCTVDYTNLTPPLAIVDIPVVPDVASACNLSSDCDDPQAKVWVPGADKVVKLNHGTSWVKLTTVYGVKTVLLQGGLAVDDVSPRRILAAAVFGDDVTWNGTVFQMPKAGVSTPMTFTKSGTTITLTAANANDRMYARVYQANRLVGWFGSGSFPRGELVQTGTGTGTLTTTSLVYNHSQVWAGPGSLTTTIQVHLEGAVTAHAP